MSCTRRSDLGRGAATAVVVILLLLLASCTDSGSNGAGGERLVETSDSNPAQNADATAPADDLDGHQRGGKLIVLADTRPVTLDPTRASRPDELAILSLVTRSLTQYKYDPDSGHMVLVPDLATGLGEPNADFTSWTFTLRPGLTYADGSTVRPADVAYAVKRSFAARELPGGLGHNRDYFVDGNRYRGPYRDGPAYAGVTVSGDSVTIKMRRPFPDMAYYAATPAFTPIPAEADGRPRRYGMDPLATGPYEFDSYKPGKRLVLRRNQNWDGDSDPVRHQYPETWDFRFGVNSNAIDELLIDDDEEAQVTVSYADVQTENYPRALLDGSVGERLVSGTAPCTDLWQLDMRAIPSLEVRRAIGLAFPYRQMWRIQGAIEGVTRLPASTIMAPGTEGRMPYDVLGNAGARTEPEAAAALLAAADKVGFELHIDFDRITAGAEQTRGVLTAAFEKAGFTVATAPTVGDMANVRPGQWCADWPSGSRWFPGAINDPTLLDRPDVDNRISEISETQPDADAAQEWGELDRYIQQTYYPAVTTGYRGRALLHGSRVGGMTISRVSGMPNFTDMYVERP